MKDLKHLTAEASCNIADCPDGGVCISDGEVCKHLQVISKVKKW